MRKSYIWATAITVSLGLWMASPYLMGPSSPEEGAAVETAAPEKLFKVRVKNFTAIPRVAVVTANGVTAASKRVDARARTNGTIMETLFSKAGAEGRRRRWIGGREATAQAPSWPAPSAMRATKSW
jgi:hypothetical protein